MPRLERVTTSPISAGPLPARPSSLAAPAPPPDASAAGAAVPASAADTAEAETVPVPRPATVVPPLPRGLVVRALLAAVFCFPPTGVAALRHALCARDLRRSGDPDAAAAAAAEARRFAAASAMIGALFYLGILVLAFAAGTA